MAGPDDKDISTLVSELWDLIVRYAKQEALDPLRDLGRYLKWGVAGAVLLAVGVPLLALGGLRAMQEELGPSHLNGSLSWVPYAAVILGGTVIAALLVRGIMAEKRRADREREQLRKRGG
ncbi:MAG TPA: phage holin family protein [Acidimicrobiales bacterium]|nr:phage holin family protein [Acidimicrobiales bacterium]